MKISGFTFIRNGIKLRYPFLESIQSVLPVCDEFIVAVGNSEDATRVAIQNLNNPKIRIIDTIWDDQLRTGGKILAQQTDTALAAITGDWGFYLQGDELVHENDLPLIVAAAEKYLHDTTTDGLLFPYYHFYGNYHYISKPKTRGTYPYEVRLIRNNPMIRSFRDAQGFRKIPIDSNSRQQVTPQKLNVRKIDAHIYHYGKVRGPKEELERSKDFHRLWHDDAWISAYAANLESFQYHPDYPLIRFTGEHPAVMKKRIQQTDWDYRYDPAAVRIPLRHRVMNLIETVTGLRPFDFRNYKLIK